MKLNKEIKTIYDIQRFADYNKQSGWNIYARVNGNKKLYINVNPFKVSYEKLDVLVFFDYEKKIVFIEKVLTTEH